MTNLEWRQGDKEARMEESSGHALRMTSAWTVVGSLAEGVRMGHILGIFFKKLESTEFVIG